jgi:hypothetical protein
MEISAQERTNRNGVFYLRKVLKYAWALFTSVVFLSIGVFGAEIQRGPWVQTRCTSKSLKKLLLGRTSPSSVHRSGVFHSPPPSHKAIAPR